MTVGELIAKLQQFDPELPVVLHDKEYDWDDTDEPDIVELGKTDWGWDERSVLDRFHPHKRITQKGVGIG